MVSAPLSPMFQASGPFATVLVDVSRDNENAAQASEVRADQDAVGSDAR